MDADLARSLRAKLSLLQSEPLSGGIVAKNLHISDNGSGESVRPHYNWRT